MRTILIAASLLSSSFLRFCDNADDKAKAPASAAQVETSKASAQADMKGAAQGEAKAGAGADVSATAVPSIGGSLVTLGAHRAEIALHEQGLVEGQVTVASGAPVVEPAKVKLAVTANTEGAARQRVELKWDPARQRFVGRARAKTKLAAGPVDVELNAGDARAQATLASAAVLGAPEFGGAVMAVGEYAVELSARPAGDVEVHVKNAAGTELDGSANINLKAKLQASAGGAPDISLKWDPARSAFSGRAEAGVQLTPGRAEIQLVAGGPMYIGGLSQLSLAGVASHGGRVVVAGDYSVELVHDGGLLLAYVMDASGKAHAGGDLDLGLRLGADAAAVTRLKWDAPKASYKANVAANFDLAMQPVRVEIKAGGRLHAGAYGRVNSAAIANLNAKANADGIAKADATLAAKAPQLRAKANLNESASARAGVKAALPKVNVTAPKINVTAPKVNANATKSGSASGSARAGISFGTK